MKQYVHDHLIFQVKREKKGGHREETGLEQPTEDLTVVTSEN